MNRGTLPLMWSKLLCLASLSSVQLAIALAVAIAVIVPLVVLILLGRMLQ